MAVVSVVEYESYGGANGVVGQVPLEPKLASYNITINGSHTEGQALNDRTTLVRIEAGDVSRVEIGPPGTQADGTSGRFAAGAVEYRGVPKGQNFVVSVITST